MYAAVPRITPCCVARMVIVGDCAILGARTAAELECFRQTEIQHLHRAVIANDDVGRLQVTMHDAALVRGFDGVGDLPRDGQRLVG